MSFLLKPKITLFNCKLATHFIHPNVDILPHFVENNFLQIHLLYKSRDSSVGIALDYGLDDRGSRVRFPEGAGNFSLHHCVQNGSGAHPASYPMGTRGSFRGGKAAGS
jgi:hypothetical protein